MRMPTYEYIAVFSMPERAVFSNWKTKPGTVLTHFPEIQFETATGKLAKLLVTQFPYSLPKKPTISLWNSKPEAYFFKCPIMKCHKHVDRDAVGTCMDCHVGLCSECSKSFSIPICPSCNLKRLTSDKSEIT